jgi:hypothetical protein
VQLDLRTPIGWLFILYGVLLLGFGLLNYSMPNTRIGADIACGAALLTFGVIVLLVRGGKRHE